MRIEAFTKLKTSLGKEGDRTALLALDDVFKLRMQDTLDKILTTLIRCDFRLLLHHAGIGETWNATNMFSRVGLFHLRRYPMAQEISQQELTFSLHSTVTVVQSGQNIML
jgi:hypothetical protein